MVYAPKAINKYSCKIKLNNHLKILGFYVQHLYTMDIPNMRGLSNEVHPEAALAVQLPINIIIIMMIVWQYQLENCIVSTALH